MKTTNLSQGNPTKVLLLFALPMILSVTLQQVYNIADSAIAGNFINSDALASVSITYPITMIYLSVATGLGAGIGVITSKFFGANDFKNTKTTITTSLIFSAILSLAMIIFGTCIIDWCLKAIDTPIEVFEDSKLYLKFYVFGLGFTYLYNVITCIFQSLGNSKTPLYFLIFSTVLNIILDLVFVICFKMEVLGLALGTFIAQGFAMLGSLFFLLKAINKQFTEKTKLFDSKILKSVLVIAIPSIIQGATISLGQFFVQKKINSFGADLVAGYGAAYKLCYVVIHIFLAYSNAISNYTAQNIGAKTYDRITKGFKSSLWICLGFYVLMALVLILLPNVFLSIFLNSDANSEVVKYGTSFIYIVTPFLFLTAIKISIDGVLKGSKDMFSFILGTFLDLIVRTVLVFVLGDQIGYVGIYIAWPIGWFIGALSSITLYFVGRWKRKANFPNIEKLKPVE